MTDYEKNLAELAEVGFTPGCLVKVIKKKHFWREYNVPVVERLKLEDGSYREWIRGEKFASFEDGTILMFLGLLNREVNLGEVNENRGISKSDPYGQRRLMCFLHEQKIVWWDYSSIQGGAEILLEKFEVVSGREADTD